MHGCSSRERRCSVRGRRLMDRRSSEVEGCLPTRRALEVGSSSRGDTFSVAIRWRHIDASPSGTPEGDNIYVAFLVATWGPSPSSCFSPFRFPGSVLEH
ncbi:hypothetical protein Taro_016870 [Colocasia esculenta]|uniref:Uncharacterized protein n=1 Tax=Colocasia esculenta TaxID=4460 RepID=A0A843UM03_COLES|nr:hypothetical protein [Colocasia esculenta]